MKIIGTFVIVFSVVFALNASNQVPLDPHSNIQVSGPYGQSMQDQVDMKIAYPAGVKNNPFYHCLEILTLDEKENAIIEIEYMTPVSKEIENFSQQIEQTWNTGHFNEALQMCAELENMEGVKGNALILISWRTPVPAPVSDWGNDVLISPRDSVFVLAMDRHNASGNLFAVLGFTGDGMGSKYTTNISTDGGATWSETFALGGFQYVMNDVDGCVCADHFYVAYTGGVTTEPNSMCWLLSFRAADGVMDSFPNGSYTYNLFNQTLPDTIMDVEFSSNHDEFNNRLYVLAIIKNGMIRFFWGYPDVVNWTEITTGVTDALQGLDANWNYNFSDYWLVFTYLDDTDSLLVYGIDLSETCNRLIGYNVNGTYSYSTTSCGGWRDTLFCTFQYEGTNIEVRYLVRYGAGGGWYFGFLAPDTTVSNYTPDVTLRHGGGIHGVYRGPYTNYAYYRYRGYAGSWSTPEQYNEQYASSYVRPEIEYVDDTNIYGVLFRTPAAQNEMCYFTRSDWVGVEEVSKDATSRWLMLAPNPSYRIARLSYVVSKAGDVRISLYDAIGRLIKTLVDETKPAGEYSLTLNNHSLAAGVYFIRVEMADEVTTEAMTIVK